MTSQWNNHFYSHCSCGESRCCLSGRCKAIGEVLFTLTHCHLSFFHKPIPFDPLFRRTHLIEFDMELRTLIIASAVCASGISIFISSSCTSSLVVVVVVVVVAVKVIQGYTEVYCHMLECKKCRETVLVSQPISAWRRGRSIRGRSLLNLKL